MLRPHDDVGISQLDVRVDLFEAGGLFHDFADSGGQSRRTLKSGPKILTSIGFSTPDSR